MDTRKICLVAFFCCSVLLLPSLSVGEHVEHSGEHSGCTFDDKELEPDARSPHNTNPDYTWPEGKIPFVFTRSVSEGAKKIFRKNMALIQKHTCFRYYEQSSIPRQKYLEINVENKGSANSCMNGRSFRFSAYVSNRYVRSQNKMYLNSRYQLADQSSCIGRPMFEGGILHEMFHALAVGHTQKRKDRDNYVKVNDNNIQDPNQYSVCWNCLVYPGIPYECNSIMHYGTKTLGKQGAGPTMTSRTRSCKLTEWGSSTPTANDWKLLKIIANKVCSGGSSTGGSGTWSSWQTSGYCSVTCGTGTQKQRRSCIGGTGCQGNTSRYVSCTKSACKTGSMRCTGQNDGCCTRQNPCGEGEGDCDKNSGHCKPGLVCGTDNCGWKSGWFGIGKDDCCQRK